MFPLLGILVPLMVLAKWLCVAICALSCVTLYCSVKRGWQLLQFIAVVAALISGLIGIVLMVTERL